LEQFIDDKYIIIVIDNIIFTKYE